MSFEFSKIAGKPSWTNDGIYLVDITNMFDIQYNTDYGIRLDNNSRIERIVEDYPDFIEKNNSEQAF